MNDIKIYTTDQYNTDNEELQGTYVLGSSSFES